MQGGKKGHALMVSFRTQHEHNVHLVFNAGSPTYLNLMGFLHEFLLRACISEKPKEKITGYILGFPAFSCCTSFLLIFESPELFQDPSGHEMFWSKSEIKIQFLYKSWSFDMDAIQ